MTQSVQVINWQPTTAGGVQSYVGIQQCIAATDTNWRIGCRGTRDDTAANIKVKYALVDNIANNAICTISFGPFVYSVPQFTRKTFRLPDNCDVLTLNLTTGIVTIYLVESRDLLSDDANLYNISTAAGTNVVYTWITYTAAIVNQVLATDSNHNLSFSRAGGLQYNLLAVGSIPNGYINPCIINAGSGNLIIVPSGLDTIIGVGATIYTNANPLVLAPGERILLSCDGSQWFAFDHSGFFTNHIFGTVGLNGDPVVDNSIPMRVQARGFNDVGLELSRWSATEFLIRSYNRNTSTFRRLTLDASDFLIELLGSAVGQINSLFKMNLQSFFGGSDPRAMITSGNSSLASGAFFDMNLATAGGFSGLLIATNLEPGNSLIRTETIYAVLGRFNTLDALIVLATANGPTGPAPFTITLPGAGVLRFTNNDANACDCTMVLYGARHF